MHPGPPSYSFASGVAMGAAWGYAWGGCNWGHLGDVDVQHPTGTRISTTISTGATTRTRSTSVEPVGAGKLAAQPGTSQECCLQGRGYGEAIWPVAGPIAAGANDAARGYGDAGRVPGIVLQPAPWTEARAELDQTVSRHHGQRRGVVRVPDRQPAPWTGAGVTAPLAAVAAAVRRVRQAIEACQVGRAQPVAV